MGEMGYLAPTDDPRARFVRPSDSNKRKLGALCIAIERSFRFLQHAPTAAACRQDTARYWLVLARTLWIKTSNLSLEFTAYAFLMMLNSPPTASSTGSSYEVLMCQKHGIIVHGGPTPRARIQRWNEHLGRVVCSKGTGDTHKYSGMLLVPNATGARGRGSLSNNRG